MENEREVVWEGVHPCAHIDIEISLGHRNRDTPQAVKYMSLVLRKDIRAGDIILKSGSWVPSSG